MENKENFYNKITRYPKKLFGNKLSEIILVGERVNPIEEIPDGQTYTYSLHILVDLPPKEIEKYSEELAAYYKNKTKNTRFKLEAMVFNAFHYKLRNHFIVPIENIIVYTKDTHALETRGRIRRYYSRLNAKN